MNINIQIKFLENYFKTNKIKNKSSHNEMSNIEVERIRKLIKTNKKDGEFYVSSNFILQLEKGIAIIKDNI